MVCTDSQSALATLQSSPLGIGIWSALRELSAGGRRIYLQWVPSHCGLPRKREGRRHREGGQCSGPDQRAHRRPDRAPGGGQDGPNPYHPGLAGRVVPSADGFAPPACCRRGRSSSRGGRSREPATAGPAPPSGGTGSSRAPPGAARSARTRSAALCPVCREEANTPGHVLLRCPALMRTRFRLLGAIAPSPEDMRSDDVVAALGAAHRTLQSLAATPL